MFCGCSLIVAMNVINTIKFSFVTLPKKIRGLDLKRYMSNVLEEIKEQNELFNAEQKWQKESIGRIEKIEVKYEGPPETKVMIMNKNISTPYDCAKHLGEKYYKKAVVALLNGESPWHMYRPIPDSCKLELLHYQIKNPTFVNNTFWRSCSFLLGATLKNVFKENVKLHLHSFPSPNIKSGSFIYDVQLSLDDWKPTSSELKALSLEMIKFCLNDYKIECLTVSKNLALSIFKANPHKTQQIPSIAEHNSNRVTLYRVNNHIDISKGPMIPNTSHLGRITIANVIKLNSDFFGGPIYRFQGVALPKPIVLNHFVYNIIEERAKTLNSARIPDAQEVTVEDNHIVSKFAY